MPSRSFILPHAPSFGGRLEGVVDLPPDATSATPTVVLCHGFKGFLSWGFFPPLATLLAERGFVVVRFNFSGSGVAAESDVVHDEDAFRRNTFSLEHEELLAMLSALETVTDGAADPNAVSLLGHSRGAGAALLAAADPAWRDRLRALVTWNGVATFERWGAPERAAWRERGEVEIRNARTGQVLALGIELLDDLETRSEALDLERAAATRRCPWLIVHGRADETVPLAEGERLTAVASPPCELMAIEGGSHTFGARHPFAGPTRELIAAMNASQRWLRRHGPVKS
ncbi:MAG: alpha/beta hydrolase [Acidobacteriota bacterium]